MPRTCSVDLRERALAAGEGGRARIAERYLVVERTLSGCLKAARGGPPLPKAHHDCRAPLGGGRGRRPR